MTEDNHLAKTLASVQYHYQQAIEELALGEPEKADVHLVKAYTVLEEYLKREGYAEDETDE